MVNEPWPVKWFAGLKSGTCGTCRTGLLGGVALHRDLVLMEDEHAANIMICVSRAKSDELTIDR